MYTTHTHSQGVKFLIVESYVFNIHRHIMNLNRCIVCTSLCLCVQSSQWYFVLPITLLRQTARGAGTDKESPVVE